MVRCNSRCYFTSLSGSFPPTNAELQIIEEIGRGGFGCVSKAIWRGTVVAAKEVPTAGNAKMLDNELAVYRYDYCVHKMCTGS